MAAPGAPPAQLPLPLAPAAPPAAAAAAAAVPGSAAGAGRHVEPPLRLPMCPGSEGATSPPCPASRPTAAAAAAGAAAPLSAGAPPPAPAAAVAAGPADVAPAGAGAGQEQRLLQAASPRGCFPRWRPALQEPPCRRVCAACRQERVANTGGRALGRQGWSPVHHGGIGRMRVFPRPVLPETLRQLRLLSVPARHAALHLAPREALPRPYQQGGAPCKEELLPFRGS